MQFGIQRSEFKFIGFSLPAWPAFHYGVWRSLRHTQFVAQTPPYSCVPAARASPLASPAGC